MPVTPVDIIPLGGLGEVGMNMMLYESEGEILIVDCGLTFSTAETPGIDAILPDTQYLSEHLEKVRAIILTHGHEDHIGAVPYLWPEIPAPIYGSAMTLGMLENKLREHDLLDDVQRHCVAPCQKLTLGPFQIEFLPVTHSIVDGFALAITTGLGTIIHTGDFKIDHTPVGGPPADLHAFARYGEQGVLALLSDSTNVKTPGSTGSERTLRPVFEELFLKTEGLVVVATFSSHIQRIRQIIDVATQQGRKIVLSGRSMVSNLRVAHNLGYLNVGPDILVNLKDIEKHPRNRLLVLSTGSQGEPRSALLRMSRGEHRDISLQVGDTVILSSKTIPGNERAVGTLINLLYKSGAEVIHERIRNVHVSGHASREDLKLMMALTRPRFFVPIHGERRHLSQHRDLALSMGIDQEHALVAENGDRIRLDGETISVVDQVPSGRIFVDGKSVGDLGDFVLRDRRHLSEYGMVVVVLVAEKKSGRPLLGPELLTRGVVDEEINETLLKDAKACVEEALTMEPDELDFREQDEAELNDMILRALRRFFKRRLGKRPVILPLVMEM